MNHGTLFLTVTAAPRETPGNFGAGFGARSMDRSRFDGAPPPMREDPPLPTAPPFTAFVVNLSFESTEADVRAFFEPMNPISVRLVHGHDGRPRGYGYVEFATLDELKDALTFTGKALDNRNVRVSVAEQSSRSMRSAAADDASQWRRTTPLPADDRRGPFGGDASISGFDNMTISEDGSRAGFGRRFTPSDGMPRRRGPLEPMEPSVSDTASDWRTGKPVTGKPSRFGFGGDGEGRGRRDGGFMSRRFEDDGRETWRSSRPAANSSGERRKLELKPRSSGAEQIPTNLASNSARSNPFGSAKPVDVTGREREIDEKIRSQERARRVQRPKAEELASQPKPEDSDNSAGPKPRSNPWASLQTEEVDDDEADESTA